VTIAAGFVYDNGVMLCADTEITGWGMKLQSGKIKSFRVDGGTISMAYAGNASFAISTIQKCQRKLLNIKAADTLQELERILDKEYRRNVLSHPGHASDPNLAYQLLIAFHPEGADQTDLYMTDQTSIHQVSGHTCIGIGEALAHYLILPNYTPGMAEKSVMSIATIALAAVKSYVPNCGGASYYVSVTNDGSIKQAATFVTIGAEATTRMEWLERDGAEFVQSGRRLLLALVDPIISDDAFDIILEGFSMRAKAKRDELNSSIASGTFINEF